MTITRDTLSEALIAVRTEAAAHGDVRVDLARLNGSVEGLATEVRITLKQQREDLEDVKGRVTTVERHMWRSVGGALVLGAVMGAGGALVI